MVLGSLVLAQDGTVKSGSGVINITSVNDNANNYVLNIQDSLPGYTGTVTVTGSVNVGQINTFAQNYNVRLLGSAVNVTGNSASTFANTGTNTFGDGGDTVDTLTFAGGLVANGSVSLAGKMVTTNNLLNLGSVTMTKNSTLQSGLGTITVGSVTDGTSNYTLSVQNDSNVSTNRGSVIFNGNVDIFCPADRCQKLCSPVAWQYNGWFRNYI